MALVMHTKISNNIKSPTAQFTHTHTPSSPTMTKLWQIKHVFYYSVSISVIKQLKAKQAKEDQQKKKKKKWTLKCDANQYGQSLYCLTNYLHKRFKSKCTNEWLHHNKSQRHSVTTNINKRCKVQTQMCDQCIWMAWPSAEHHTPLYT